MVFSYCKCSYHLAGNENAAANFYNTHFVPDGWELVYSKLSECRSIHLKGRCKDCYGDLNEMIPLPEGLSGDALFQAIYDAMWSAHPYDAILEHIGYHGPCEERSAFYRRRDKTSQFRRSTKFLDLFHDYDREAARLWLEKTFPPQKHTEVLRDTGGSLFSSVIRMAKEAGEFGKAKAILDYILPCEHEESIREKVKLTAYEFDFQPCINYGCEGIFIDCYLMGKFDESGRSKLHVGTLKTLRRDAEAAKIMGELCGVLLHYEKKYVNGNLHRYTPEKELEQEYQRQLEQEKNESVPLLSEKIPLPEGGEI